MNKLEAMRAAVMRGASSFSVVPAQAMSAAPQVDPRNQEIARLRVMLAAEKRRADAAEARVRGILTAVARRKPRAAQVVQPVAKSVQPTVAKAAPVIDLTDIRSKLRAIGGDEVDVEEEA